ncbi:MAG: tyrosine-type recombinase/integrase [Rhodospirillaceae bacterium]|nr:tyrosine-type recombinase/integrase [Rhodospirillaceae bacterium]
MQIRIKYVTVRPSLKDPKRWYWQRPGHDLVRLSNDPAIRLTQVTQLNADADDGSACARGSVAWVVEQYQASDDYLALKRGTLKYYKRFLNDLRKLFGKLPFKEAMTRRVSVDFVRRYKPSMRRQAAAVLVNVFNVALYYHSAEVNHAHKLKLKGGNRRETTFEEDQHAAWLTACGGDAEMRLAYTILRYSVQRPGDVLKMLWDRYNGDTIKLRQEKTGKLVEVPCHAELRQALDYAKRDAKTVFIVSNGYKPLSYSRFRERFRRIADRAGLPGHQARDLRRSAAVRMSEAGATIQQISAVAGWSIDYTQRILETYIPRNVEMGRGAIAKWEQREAEKSNALEKK